MQLFVKLFKNSLTQVIILSFLFLCFVSIGIGNEAFWLDESETVMWSYVSLPDLLKITAESNHAPTYYAAMHIWILVGDDSEEWTRFLSALFMTASVPIIYLFGRIVNNHRTGIFCILIFASSPYIYSFAQEARPYAMLVFFGAVSMMCMAMWVRDVIHEKRPEFIGIGWKHKKIKSNLLWLLFIISTTILITTHHTAVLFPVIASAAYFIIMLFSKYRTINFINLFIVNFIIILLYLPFLPFFIISLNLFVQEPISFFYAMNQINMVYGNNSIRITAIIIGFSTIFMLWKWYKYKQWHWMVFLLIMWLGMLVLVACIGIAHGSVLKHRTLIWTFVPLVIMIGAGMTHMKWSYVLVACLVGLNIGGIFLDNSHVKSEWNRIVYNISSEYQTNDAVVICPDYYHKVFLLYWDENTTDLWGYKQGNKEIYPMTDLNSNLTHNRFKSNTYDKEILTAQYDRIWVVLNTAYQPCGDIDYGESVYSIDYGPVEVSLYETGE